MKRYRTRCFRGIVLFCILIMQNEFVKAESFDLISIDPRVPLEQNETCVHYALRGGFLSWAMAERNAMSEDPTILITLVNFYELNEGQPYWFLIAENWLACGIYSLEDGRKYTGWQIGDLNLDGIVNLKDLKLYSRIKEGWTGEP